ncbi:MAG TPA: LuxR C-terminal-related transcriptional regulator [Streptosporangiaceae bacterium]|nr:LuxR C-terminal-related transcriptional regulator [Streptosporangiaceae bacterium]
MSDSALPRAVASDGSLVGRDSEAEFIGAFIDRAAAEGGALRIEGAAGVGKTAILGVAADRARAAGIRVLPAVGAEFEADVGFAGLHQLLQPLLGSLSELDAAHSMALTVALGLGGGSLPGQLLIANAALALIRQAAVVTPVLVIVDDVPWLDRASAVVLGFVARRLAGSRIGLLAASRPEEGSFFEGGGLPRYELGPLGRSASAALLQVRFPAMAPRVRQRLLDDAQGNPLALLELPVALGDVSQTAAGVMPPVLPLSRRLETVFAARIRNLPAATFDLLLLAALSGTADLRLLRAPRSAGQDIADLSPAERAGMVRVASSTGRVVFRHPLIRSAVVEMATADQRRHAHRVLADRLADHPERRTWHLAEAAVEPDEQLAALLQGVAHANLRRGHGVGAVSELLRAAELSPGGTDRASRLAEAAYLGSIVTGDLRDAPRLLKAAKQADQQEGGTLAAAVAGSYHLLNADGDVDTAHRLMVEAIENLADNRNAHIKALIEGLYTLLLVCFFSGRADMWGPLDAAVSRLEPQVPELLAILSQTFSDPARRAVTVLDRLDAAVAALSEETIPARIVRTGIAGSYLDRLAACRAALWRVVADGRQGGAITSAIEALFLVANDAYFTGQWEQADDVIEEGLMLCETHGYPLLAWPGIFLRALLAAARGDDDTVSSLADQMIAWSVPRGVRVVHMYASHARTLAALGRADFEAAFNHASAISPAGTLAPFVPHALWLIMDLVEAASRSGRTAEAQAHVTAVAAAGVAGLSPRLGLIAGGAAAMAATDHACRDLFDAALAIPGADRWPFDVARIHLSYGERLRRMKATTEARAHLVTAQETFTRLGARPWATRASNELRATGLTIGQATALGPASLTPQQRQIAELAATGLTNKQIGERLYLSPRTVATHLHQLFPKLGVTTRAALRDALADQPPERL